MFQLILLAFSPLETLKQTKRSQEMKVFQTEALVPDLKILKAKTSLPVYFSFVDFYPLNISLQTATFIGALISHVGFQ